MSSNRLNLKHINPTQTQFDNLTNLITTNNSELSDVNDEIIAINHELNLKANSSDVNASFISINQRLDTKNNSTDLATRINNLNAATTNALNANSISSVSMLTLTNATIQSELALKSDLSDMISGSSNLTNTINLTTNILTSGFRN